MKWHTTLMVNAPIFLMGFLWVAQMNATAAQESPFAYPESVIKTAGIAPATITKHRGKFKKDPVHREWIQHVHALLPDLDSNTQETVVQIHTSFLYIKDALDAAYRKGRINRSTFENQVGHLFNWFQNVHSSVLNPGQYQALFAAPAEEEPDEIDSAEAPLGFPIENDATSAEMIKEQFDTRSIEAVKALYQQLKQELAVIVKAHKEGSIPAQEFEHIKNELHLNYMNGCRDVLTDEQFELLFGSVGN